LVIDIPAGDGKIANLLIQCIDRDMDNVILFVEQKQGFESNFKIFLGNIQAINKQFIGKIGKGSSSSCYMFELIKGRGTLLVL